MVSKKLTKLSTQLEKHRATVARLAQEIIGELSSLTGPGSVPIVGPGPVADVVPLPKKKRRKARAIVTPAMRIECAKLLKGGATLGAVAAKLGVSTSTVRNMRKARAQPEKAAAR